MAELILPNKKLDVPSFFYPKRKPDGKVKLNKSHYLAPDECCVLLGGVVYDAMCDVVIQPNARGEQRVVREGLSGEAIEFNLNDNLNSFYALPIPIMHHVAGDLWSITWFGRNKLGDASATTVLGASANEYLQQRKNNSVRIRTNSVNYEAGVAPAYDILAWNTVVFTANGYDFYKNGVYQTQYTGSNAPAALDISRISVHAGASKFSFKGAIGALYIHSWGLSAEQIFNLHSKPYQFLEPI